MDEPDMDFRARVARSLALDLPEGEHLSADQLIAYRSGRLGEEAADTVQEHLSLCPACLADLQELEAFVAAGEPGEEKAASLEAAATWKGVRQRLEPRHGSPWTSLAAAALLAVAAGLGWWGLEQRSLLRELQAVGPMQPLADIPIVDVFPSSGERGGDDGDRRFEVPASATFVTLVLHVPDAEGQGTLDVELLDPEGSSLWTGNLRVSEYGTLRLGLPRAFLGPGKHRLRVFVPDGDGRRLLEDLPFDVAFGVDEQ
ncbi:MAG: hypothetical protein KDD47_11870 [Acidobacteria bacterium]|nr:hypothetical protein [Acidobacteriota bacterium]